MVPLIRTAVGAVLVPLIGAVVNLLSRNQHVPEKRVPRRMFLRNVLLGSTVIVVLELLGGFVYFFWPLKTGTFGSKITVPASSVPPDGEEPLRVQEGKFFLINNPDGLLALYWKCPHLGCTVPWAASEDKFHCPCHGSIYDRHGVLTSGPAPRPMDLMAIEISDSNVIVDTGTITERSEWTPEQSTPYPG